MHAHLYTHLCADMIYDAVVWRCLGLFTSCMLIPQSHVNRWIEDLKPENIMLNGEKPEIMLVDFGLAREAGKELEEGKDVAQFACTTMHYNALHTYIYIYIDTNRDFRVMLQSAAFGSFRV